MALRLGLKRMTSRRKFFFFQAEDGIRDYKVTGVQTCALPIFAGIGGIRADYLVAAHPVDRLVARSTVFRAAITIVKATAVVTIGGGSWRSKYLTNRCDRPPLKMRTSNGRTIQLDLRR